MKVYLISCSLLLMLLYSPSTIMGQAKPLFDGKTFKGWEGDTLSTWRIENAAIVGGSLDHVVPNNDFLCTDRSYSNFVLKLKIKLIGSEGFINSGIQFRSVRLEDPQYEMSEYQADWGEGYWASLYDESRRNKTMMAPDSVQVMKWIKIDEWNDYEIRAEDRRIRLYINGHETVDYTETDSESLNPGLLDCRSMGAAKRRCPLKP